MQKSPQWRPDPEVAHNSQIARFTRELIRHEGLAEAASSDYNLLQSWSTEHLSKFWLSLANFYNFNFNQPSERILSSDKMPGAKWFEGAKINYVDQISLEVDDDQPAIIVEHENGESVTHTHAEFRSNVAMFAAHLKNIGVEQGDRVVGYLPSCYEGVVAFYAVASIGAIWSQTGMDYNAQAAADRLAQLEPKVLITGTGYTFRGKNFDRVPEVTKLQNLLPTVIETVEVPTLEGRSIANSIPWQEALVGHENVKLQPTPVDFSHPLWVLFTSGTTGKPKGVVHSHGGVLLEHYKSLGLHMDLEPGDTFFWYTTPNWMMWNILVSGLLLGATVVLYTGDPIYPDPSRLWKLVEKHAVTIFGTSPGQLAASEMSGVKPAKNLQLKSIMSTGSTLPASANEWIRSHFGDRVQLGSVSGGTDIAGAFVGTSPVNDVWDGQISAVALGVALETWNDAGEQVTDEVGEMVITKPMPSMPVKFWNDPSGERYRDAYFATYPGVWRQGDWITQTSWGTVMMHGRSDATLNRKGVRLGSAEIYAAVESLPEVQDSLIVGVEREDGSYWMPLFIVPNQEWSEEHSEERVRKAIVERASKQHQPDDVILIETVPRTKTGKKMEVPVKRIIQGADPHKNISLDVTDTPEALLSFARFSEDR